MLNFRFHKKGISRLSVKVGISVSQEGISSAEIITNSTKLNNQTMSLNPSVPTLHIKVLWIITVPVTHGVQCTQITAYNTDISIADILTAEVVKIAVCWNVTPSIWQEYTIVSEEIFIPIFRVIMVEGSSEMLVNSHQTSVHYIPEDDSRNWSSFLKHHWSEHILNENVPLSK